MRSAVSIDDPGGSAIAHDTCAARMTEIEFNVLREKSQTPSLQAIGQKLPEEGPSLTQFSLDGVFEAHAIGLIFVEYNAILRVREILNETHEDRTATESLDCHGRRNSHKGSKEP